MNRYTLWEKFYEVENEKWDDLPEDHYSKTFYLNLADFILQLRLEGKIL